MASGGPRKKTATRCDGQDNLNALASAYIHTLLPQLFVLPHRHSTNRRSLSPTRPFVYTMKQNNMLAKAQSKRDVATSGYDVVVTAGRA